MKTTRHRLPFVVLLFVLLGGLMLAHGQITSKQDAYTDSSKPTTNFGAAATLGVANTAPSIQSSYILFDLSSIPAGYTDANVAKATLKLYVNSVAKAGSFNVDFVNGSWKENGITFNLAPALGSTIQGSVPLTTANTNGYLVIDVTSALKAWLNGSQINDGIALVANSPFSATFDSNENTAQSHPPELDVVFNGAITGINTAAGSGLSGGGSSGTLNLSLLKSCSSGQTLAWNGTAWACKTVSGTGTVTSVNSGLGLKGGPITTSGTLSIDPTVVPQLTTANTFTGNQTMNGNVSAKQLVSTASTGTAPLQVASTTQVANLNASLLGGLTAGSFAKLSSNIFTGNQMIQSGMLGVNTTTPLSVSTLEADVNAPGVLGPVLSLVNLGGNFNAAAAMDFKTYAEVGSPYNPGARIEAVDVGNFGDNIVFLLNNPGAPSNGLAEVLRLTPRGIGRTRADGLQVTDSAGDGSDGLISQAADGNIGTGVVSGGFGVTAVGGNARETGSIGGAGVSAHGGSTTVSGSAGGDGVIAVGGGGNGSGSSNTGGEGVLATGGDNSDPSGFGGFGIEATGGFNGDGTVARAGEFHGDVEIQGCLGVAGTPNIGTCTSDVRLKRNIQPFPAVLDKLVRLQPVSYNWRVEEYPQLRFGTSRASGLIAQEVEKVFPELVSVGDGGLKRVNYGELPYLTLQAIRELKSRNDKLAAQAKARDAQIRKLTRQVKQLQTVQQQLAAFETRLAQVEAGRGNRQTAAVYAGGAIERGESLVAGHRRAPGRIR